MINILFYIDKLSYNGFIGGAEKALINLVNNMDATKYRIVVQTIFPDVFASKLNKGIQYKCCFAQKNRWTKLQYRMELASGILYRKRIKESYDIEVAYLEYESTKAIAASTNTTAKKVAWIHCDLNIAVKDKAAFVKKAAKQYSQFDQIVCVSEQCKKSFAALFGMAEKVSVLRNVVDDKEVLEKAEALILDDNRCSPPVICSVGSFTPPKNHIRLLKATKKMWDEGLRFRIWLVGDGALRPQIERFIQENNMEEYISLLGFQSNPYPYMKRADLLVCHSDYEGFSTMATEAVILNKPIMTTECSGMHEILDEYEGGMIVSNDDNAFVNSLRVWLIDYRADGAPHKDFTANLQITAREIAKQNEMFFEELLK